MSGPASRRHKPLVFRLLYALRNIFSTGPLFGCLAELAGGRILDVGGWDFYKTARPHLRRAHTWISLEPSMQQLPPGEQAAGFHGVAGDGLQLPVRPGSFDLALCIQVLEHTYEPERMVRELVRALKPGGRLILLVPQTNNLHFVPYHYGNFTRFWIEEAARRTGLVIERLDPVGGAWRTFASRFFHVFLQSFHLGNRTIRSYRRPVLFYVLLPFALLFSALAIPVCLLFSLGDIAEEAPNHLVVARKPV